MERVKITSLLLLLLITALIAEAQNGSPTTKAADSLFITGNWVMAKQAYESVLKDTTRNSLAWNRLGFTNYNLKNYDAAIKYYQRSLLQNPSFGLKAIVYARMARIHALQHNKETAFMELDSAVSVGYSNVNELDTLTDYSSIRSETYFKHIRDQVYTNANPCMANAHAREFDFWIGEWDVYAAGTKQVVGHSLIQLIAGGCALLENWDSPGSNGKSINFIDPVSNKWKQSWAGNYANGIQEFVNGEYKDGAMRFSFETKDAKGNKLMGRFDFFNEAPGQVRQFNETSADGGKTWNTSYNFTYIKKK